MDPVQALILKLMESRAAQDRQAQIPLEYNRDVERMHSPPVGIQQLSDPESQLSPGAAQAPPDMDDSGFAGQMGPEDFIAQMLQRQRGQ